MIIVQKIDGKRLVHITNDRYRPHYHIATNGGWLNDPNGLCFYKGYYHVFYQYHPYSTEWGPMHWGHVRSKDMVHWEQLPVALVPGDPEDSGGCFSGSAIVKGDRLYLIYTGQHYYRDGDLDHFWETQNIAYSDDGIHFTKYKGNPVINAPADNTRDFRDPKVWQFANKYWLVLGSRSRANNCGRILLYQSDDLIHWQQVGTMFDSSTANNGSKMLECPDFFHLNGGDLLLCSPMGMKPAGKEFMNFSQVCYSIGHLDYARCQFTGTDLQELDKGHNFYAPQTFETPDKRRVMVAWASLFNDRVPEKADGWAGILTLPRELSIRDGHLCNEPVQELTKLRAEADFIGELTVDGVQDLAVSTPQHSEFNFTFPKAFMGQFSWQLNDRQGTLLKVTANAGQIVLNRRGEDGMRYACVPAGITDLRIFVDTSSVEIFINHGWVSMTERYYALGPVSYQLASDQRISLAVENYALG